MTCKNLHIKIDGEFIRNKMSYNQGSAANNKNYTDFNDFLKDINGIIQYGKENTELLYKYDHVEFLNQEIPKSDENSNESTLTFDVPLHTESKDYGKKLIELINEYDKQRHNDAEKNNSNIKDLFDSLDKLHK